MVLRHLVMSRLARFGAVSLALTALPAFANDGQPLQLAPEAPVVTGSLSPAERIWRPSANSDVDVAALRAAIAHAKAGRIAQATQARASISDPVARALIEWTILRHNADSVGFPRLNAFLRDYPGFPGAGRIRQRAEGALLDDAIDAATVRAFYANSTPTSAKGAIALALAQRAAGDTGRAHALVRQTWRTEDLSRDTESTVLSRFPGVLSQADHQARFAAMLHEGQTETAMRAAQRLGSGHVALARAFLAIGNKRSNGRALLASVPAGLHADPIYVFAKAQLLRREDRTQAAAAVLIGAPRDPAVLGSPEEWWTERRVMVRKLLDEGDARTAYRVAAGHSVREGAARVEAEFHAGWVALRHLNDAAAGLRHFEAARQAAGTPMSQSRALYWIGRAHEAQGQSGEARRAYEQASRHSTFYYGQLARARLGLTDLPIRRPAESGHAASVAARAVKLLYDTGERELALAMLADLGARSSDQGAMAAAAEVAARHGDARGVLTLGKGANNRFKPFDVHAFPTLGIPSYRHVGPDVDRAVVFAIARQESTFNPRAVSHAGAKGLLQLMPATARRTARNHGLSFAEGRLLSDPAFNAQIGAAHLGELLADYRGSYILTFAAYNAGAGRVREWIEAYGDPRDPRVDPVDWVERIPFSETRNYVQRVMENVQVYRARLGGGSGLRIEADLRRGRIQ